MSGTQHTWGRRTQASWTRGAAAIGTVLLSPLILLLPFVSLTHYKGALILMLADFLGHPVTFLSSHLPRPTLEALLGYTGFIVFQALLFTFLPGRIAQGCTTPAGHVLEYKVNGLAALAVTLALFAGLSFSGTINPAWIANNWGPLLVVVQVYGLVLAGAAYVKARWWPTYPGDTKFSGSSFYDFFMGVEMNPRLGRLWDVKLFQIGRAGMMAWLLVSLSFTAYQYQHLGFITNSLLIVDVLHALYVVDFFVNESWYLKTIDIEHDHFGFYFSWGGAACVPTLYTLQAQYLGRLPSQLGSWQETLILVAGVSGYLIFRSANDQKLTARQSPQGCQIWGQAPTFIKCYYKTSDDATHESKLLCSGWWGVVRHANYLGDLVLTYATCAACNTTNPIPWTYAVWLSILLVHRCIRDEERCSRKYGKYWEEYCRRVPWRIVPGVF